jgi:hypothetical protein
MVVGAATHLRKEYSKRPWAVDSLTVMIRISVSLLSKISG